LLALLASIESHRDTQFEGLPLNGARFPAQFGSDFGSRVFGRHAFQRTNIFVRPTLSYLGHVHCSSEQMSPDDLNVAAKRVLGLLVGFFPTV
jgi:hypothetical protein